ncbi:class I SAM-dependent methyltransferase [Bradyrhizobium sp. CCBAU 051011]
MRNENVEEQKFEDCSFDLMVTQDVFEHIFHPDKA